MKTFDEYQDGEWVTFVKYGHPWHLKQFQAYKSQWTHNAFRLKYGSREVIADISEIEPISETNRLVKEEYENFNTDLPRNLGRRYQEDDEEESSYVQD